MKSEKLYIDFQAAAEKSWKWLREFNPYKQDYKKFEKLLKKNQALPYFCFIEDLKYMRSDFSLNKQEALKCLKYQNELNRIWRFYPLFNPNIKSLPEDFLRCFKANFLNVDPAVESLNGKAHGFIEYYNSLKDLRSFKEQLIEKLGSEKNPKHILLSINLARNMDTIRKEFLKEMKKYKCSPERPQLSELENGYKVQVCRGLGWTIAKIAKEIWPSQYDRSPQAACKKVERFLEKYPA